MATGLLTCLKAFKYLDQISGESFQGHRFSGFISHLNFYRFGVTKSILWLQSLYFSMMICVFLLNPILVSTLSVCL